MENTFNSSTWVSVPPPAEYHLGGMPSGQGNGRGTKVERGRA